MMWPTVRTASPSQVAVFVIQRFQAIHVSTNMETAVPPSARGAHDRGQPCLERTQVVQSGQVVGHQRVYAGGGRRGQFRCDDAHRDEQHDLDKIRLLVAKCEQVRFARYTRRLPPELPPEPARSLKLKLAKIIGEVVQMLTGAEPVVRSSSKTRQQHRDHHDDRPPGRE